MLNTDVVRRDRVAFSSIAALTIGFAAFNATLIYDDLFFAEFFRFLRERPLGETFEWMLFNLFLGTREYRLYGLSTFIHVVLFWLVDTRAWAWGALIAATQTLAGYGIFRVLLRLGSDRPQAWAMAAVWIFSPFAATSCFHHYSYLILPYQLTIACVLVLQRLHDPGLRRPWLWRIGAGALGSAIALTGETHLLAAPLALYMIAWRTPSPRPLGSRIVDAVVPVAAMAATALLHRLVWSAIVPSSAAPVRYAFGLPPNADQALWRMETFLKSLPFGVTDQARAIADFAGNWAFVAAALAFLAAAALAWNWRHEKTTGASSALPAAFLALAAAGFVVVFLLSLFTGQVSLIYPRRYGYIPYTLAAMAAVGFLSAGVIRRIGGMVPAGALAAAVVGLWAILETIDLPTVRAQDGRVYGAVRAALDEKAMADVLILCAWHPAVSAPEQPPIFDTPGLRSLSFPEIFESPASRYIWLSQYIIVILHAEFVGVRAIAEKDGVRLISEGAWRRLSTVPNTAPSSVVVPASSVVVLADRNAVPPGWKDDPARRVKIERFGPSDF
jgi:hypothetical protein